MVRFAMLVGALTILPPAVVGAQESSTEPTRVWVAVGLGPAALLGAALETPAGGMVPRRISRILPHALRR